MEKEKGGMSCRRFGIRWNPGGRDQSPVTTYRKGKCGNQTRGDGGGGKGGLIRKNRPTGELANRKPVQEPFGVFPDPPQSNSKSGTKFRDTKKKGRGKKNAGQEKRRRKKRAVQIL